MRFSLPAVGWLIIALTMVASAQRPSGIPQLSSRPGADYTIYLNVGGFDYVGDWWQEPGNPVYTPGYTPPLNDISPMGSFNATEIEQIKAIWARVAQSYVGFNVNVTTIDPYDTTGDPTPTDAERRVFYDNTPNMMHTVVGSQIRDDGMGGMVKWFSNAADGVSPGIGVVAGRVDGPDSVDGQHTNWMFTEAQAGAATGFVINGEYIGAVSAHENAHSFGLYHQNDWTGTTLVNEYSLGDANPGPGSYVPIIGQADGRQRVTWRLGETHPNDPPSGPVPVIQNDVGLMLSTNTVATAGPGGLGRTGVANLALVDDGIGNTMGTATPLPLVGDQIDVMSQDSKGVIVPVNPANPQPLGVDNYTKDWFSFYTDGLDAISLTVTNSTDFLVSGVADSFGTLRSTLSIFDSMGMPIGFGTEDGSTLFSTYSSMLAAGNYFAQIASFGGHAQNEPQYNDASYFDMGAFFLTGSGFDVVPEPASCTFVLLTSVFFGFRRRNLKRS